MPTTYKILTQSAPATTNLTDVYTVAASTQVVVSTINIANLTTSAVQYRVALRQSGAAIAPQHYIIYDGTVAANDSIPLTIGVTLTATDVISVRASSAGTLSFNVFGAEITP